jgi:hypothetical protein
MPSQDPTSIEYINTNVFEWRHASPLYLRHRSRRELMDVNHKLLSASSSDHLWGYLTPVSSSPSLLRLDLWRLCPIYDFGRDPDDNEIVLDGPHVSSRQCRIEWRARDGKVIVTDLSLNGTHVSAT